MQIYKGDIIMAERVADLMADYGYAVFGDEKAAGLAASMGEYLLGEGVQTNPEEAEKFFQKSGNTFLDS